MSEYTRWQVLNESLGFPLGIKTAASLGISGGFTQLEEKKKKMDVGDEIEAEDDEEEEEEEGEDKGKKLPPWLQKAKGEAEDEKEPECPHCGCHHQGGQRFCTKMKKAKKCASKKMQTEGRWAGYDVDFTPVPEVGTEEFRQAFFKSLENHMGDPGKRWDGGVNLEEEVLLAPQEDNPLPQPQPGEPGFAPVGRVGSPMPEAPAKPAWEQEWLPVSEQMDSLIRQWDSVCKRK